MASIILTQADVIECFIVRLLALLDDCTEQEAEELIPAIRYLLTLMRHQNNPTFQKNQ